MKGREVRQEVCKCTKHVECAINKTTKHIKSLQLTKHEHQNKLPLQ